MAVHIRVKSGSELTQEERVALGLLLRRFDTYAPAPRSPGSLPIEDVFEIGETHPTRFRFFNIANQNTYFMVYEQGEDGEQRLIATATAVIAITSRKAQVTIEDLIVDEKSRKQGIGTKLMQQVMNWVSDEDMYYFIQLTCSPRRGPWINNWFEKLGFKKVGSATGDAGAYATNLYRRSLLV